MICAVCEKPLVGGEKYIVGKATGLPFHAEHHFLKARRGALTVPRFEVGAHVRAKGLCGTVSTAFDAIGGGVAYGVFYDDHTPISERPFGSPGHSYRESDLEVVSTV